MDHDDKEILRLTNEIAAIESKLKDGSQTLYPKTRDLLRSRLSYLKDRLESPKEPNKQPSLCGLP